MVRDIDVRPVLVQQREQEKKDQHVGAALRALARFTYPGLEPPSGFATGYYRTREHLASGIGASFLPLEALRTLESTGHAMRVGRGWCVTKKGRELARLAFGEALLAVEVLVEDESGHTRGQLQEGRADR